MKRHALIAALASLLIYPAVAQTTPVDLNIVAAENFYGDVAPQLAGLDVKVTSVLSNPADSRCLPRMPRSTIASLANKLV